MVKKAQDDEIYADNIRVLEFTVVDEDTVNEPPLDLTTYLVRWALSKVSRSGKFSTTPVLKKDSDLVGGIVKTDAAGGVCQVTIDPSDTALLSGLFYQELELVNTGGEPLVVAVGNITVIRNVSNV